MYVCMYETYVADWYNARQSRWKTGLGDNIESKFAYINFFCRIFYVRHLKSMTGEEIGLHRPLSVLFRYNKTQCLNCI